MAGFLFDKVVFGPVNSRRLGVSLGINLLPVGFKHCSFNCIYCECGWTKVNTAVQNIFPPSGEIKKSLENKLLEMLGNGALPEAISFAGNGEPTLHPDFAEIIDFTIELRNKYSSGSAVAVLSNATMLHLPDVVEALKKVDKNILKLDAGTEETYRLINNTLADISLEDIICNLRKFKTNLIIQSLFVRGEYQGKRVDNTTETEISKWLKYIKELKPEQVMIYPIARATPLHGLEKVCLEELNNIADKVMEAGIKAEVYF